MHIGSFVITHFVFILLTKVSRYFKIWLGKEKMSLKRTIVRKLVDVTHEWNSEIHKAIEDRIYQAYSQTIPKDAQDSHPSVETLNEMLENMRAFYYSRMSMTASLLLAGAALIISVVALLVSLF